MYGEICVELSALNNTNTHTGIDSARTEALAADGSELWISLKESNKNRRRAPYVARFGRWQNVMSKR